MIKTYKRFIYLFLIVISVLLYFLYKYNKIINQNQIDILVSNQVEIIQNELNNQKNQALSLAITFSRNQNIIDNLENNNKVELKKELIRILDIIHTYTKQNIDIQVHTADLEVFTRSWENKDTGLNLKPFREGLVKVKDALEPYVSSELGKRFNIKAITPIYNNKNVYIGSIEVIIDYNAFVNRLKSMGIDAIVLLEKKYLDIATYHKDEIALSDFVVIQKEFNKSFYDFLKNNSSYISNEKFYYETKDKVITQISLGEFDKKSVGTLMLSFDKSINKFSYLPRYEYLGDINIKQNRKNSDEPRRKEIIIR